MHAAPKEHPDADPAWVHMEHRPACDFISAGGEWTVAHADVLNRQTRSLHFRAKREIQVDAAEIVNLDIVGAWLLRTMTDAAANSHIVDLDARFRPVLGLLDGILQQVQQHRAQPFAAFYPAHVVARIGKSFVWLARQLIALTTYLGVVTIESCKTLLNVRRLRVPVLLTHIQQTGLNALPIVGLLSFAIGIVLAYQGAEQLTKFGAGQLTIDFLGIGTLRELGVLMAAIMLAGRSGSAFTAQIGAMKLNQEIDAIEVLGLESASVLVLPRILGLFVALPLLTLYADAMSILGGSVLCYFYLHITFSSFLHQLQTAITLKHLMIGLVKAPVFACIIGLIGCFEGMQFERHAESVGKLTTRSVVEAIFLVIIVDAFFSVLFSIMGV